jgi:hypothetical protein
MQVVWFLHRYLGGKHPYTVEFVSTVERADIRKNPDTSHIAVIILTSSADPEDVRRTYCLRGNCFVTNVV